MSHVDDGTLHAYLDGELLPAERTRLEAHVAECAACRSRLEDERALIARASNLLGLAQPPERAAPPLHQLRQPRLMWRMRVPIAWAATVVLAVGLGYYVRGERPAPAPPQTLASAQDSFGTMRGYTSQPQPARRSLTRAPAPTEQRSANANQVAARERALADSAAAPERLDSNGEAARVVAIPAPVALRGATPAPQPSAAVVTSRVQSDLAQERGRLVTTQWPVIRAGPARDLLGVDPVGVPGLAVRNIRRSPTGEVVLVEQALDSATTIQVFQERVEEDGSLYRRVSPARSAAPTAAPRDMAAETERLARFIGRLRVEIAGPLSTDSLNRLLEQVKPIKP